MTIQNYITKPLDFSKTVREVLNFVWFFINFDIFKSHTPKLLCIMTEIACLIIFKITKSYLSIFLYIQDQYIHISNLSICISKLTNIMLFKYISMQGDIQFRAENRPILLIFSTRSRQGSTVKLSTNHIKRPVAKFLDTIFGFRDLSQYHIFGR